MIFLIAWFLVRVFKLILFFTADFASTCSPTNLKAPIFALISLLPIPHPQLMILVCDLHAWAIHILEQIHDALTSIFRSTFTDRPFNLLEFSAFFHTPSTYYLRGPLPLATPFFPSCPILLTFIFILWAWVPCSPAEFCPILTLWFFLNKFCNFFHILFNNMIAFISGI